MDKKEQVVGIIKKHLGTEAKYLGYDKGYGWNLEPIAQEICQLFESKGEADYRDFPAKKKFKSSPHEPDGEKP